MYNSILLNLYLFLKLHAIFLDDYTYVEWFRKPYKKEKSLNGDGGLHVRLLV